MPPVLVLEVTIENVILLVTTEQTDFNRYVPSAKKVLRIQNSKSSTLRTSIY